MSAGLSHEANTRDAVRTWRLAAWLRWSMLAVAGVFYALHFLHLDADFPNHSPWVDWSKYTDEGWYGDAAIRHYLTGHWYWPGDFNPAVALPVWPALEWVWFRVAGVSTCSARTLALLMFGVTLVAMYSLVERHTRDTDLENGPALASATCVLMLCCSAFLYAFERIAIVEPLLIALTALALLVASHLRAVRLREFAREWKAVLLLLTLGVLLPAMVLTKTTALFLLPAVFYMVWARAGYRVGHALRLCWLPCGVGLAVWCGYFFGFVRPHYLEDYRYIFSANAYTGATMDSLAPLLVKTLAGGAAMGVAEYVCAFVVIALAVLWRPRMFRNPLFPSLLLWAAGYLVFIGYHFNLQPRYYTVVAVPLTAVVAFGLDNFRHVSGRGRLFAQAGMVAALLAVLVPDALMQSRFIARPEYTFRAAAEGVKRIVMSEPDHSHLVLSISGSDLTLMTGLSSIDDDFGTLTLDERVERYRPGWFAAWNELDDDKMDALSPFFKPVRVAEFPAMDDADRNLLILYRLDPVGEAEPRLPAKHKRKPVPKPLRTKLGQQPSVEQLEH